MQPHSGEDYSGKKFNGRDFSGKFLQYGNFHGATLLNCNFRDCDLRYANFTGANCYGSDFTNSILSRVNMTDCNLQRTIFKPKDAFGITITMKCETFTDMEIDDTWLKVWLFMPCQMKLPETENGKDKPWLDRIILLLGEKTYLKFRQVFANRII